MLAINEEVNKLVKVNFIEVARHPQWVANIVLVMKRNESLGYALTIDNLTKQVSKTTFHYLTLIFLWTTLLGFGRFSFMDGFSGYNHTRMADGDKEKTTFTISWGTFF